MFSYRSTTFSRLQAASTSTWSGNHVSFKRVIRLDRLSPVARFTTSNTSKSNVQFVGDEETQPFTGSSGFWPTTSKQKKDRRSRGVEKTQPGSGKEDGTGRNASNAPKDDLTAADDLSRLSVLLPRRQARKTDLSRTSVKSWESSPSSLFFQSSQPIFRENEGLRRILVSYVKHLECHISSSSAKPVQDLASVATVFSPEHRALLERCNYDVKDVVSWSWILNAGDVRQSIQRYIILSKEQQQSERGRIPLFVSLQLLRCKSIHSQSLKGLISAIVQRFQQAHVQSTNQIAAVAPWDQSSAVVLLVRLIRHAREVAPDSFEDIVSAASYLLRQSSSSNIHGQQRLSLIYNRLLSLLALPTRMRPFRSIIKQQVAQASLVRQMLQLNPPVPITREGYRALVKVQLAHEKTSGERDWAMAKSSSWPPWREDKLGIQADLDYPGQQSRALKILFRMREAGYEHHEWEKTASILAGWDTDKTPTIQTRSILRQKAMAWIGGKFTWQEKPALDCDPSLWAARVTATRTMREAWACFIAYQKGAHEATTKPNSYHVYHSMFKKLFAKAHDVEGNSQVLPGDAKELFSDPLSQRDLVFVDSDPPTIKQLYARMLADEVRPAGRLLSDLLRHAEDVREGFRYINDSSYGEVRKDVLLHAEKYHVEFIRDTISSLPDHFFAAFISLLGRSAADHSRLLIQPTSLAEGSQAKAVIYMNPLSYGRRMLYISGTEYPPAWNGLLEGLDGQLAHFQTHRVRVWKKVMQTLKYMRKSKVQPDLQTFRRISQISDTCVLPPAKYWPPVEELRQMIKEWFTRVVYGNTKHLWVSKLGNDGWQTTPDPEDIRALVNILGITQDIEGLLELVDWMDANSEQLKTAYSERRSGETAMRRTMLVIQIYLEGLWRKDFQPNSSECATAEQISTAKAKCEDFGWPPYQELKAFINGHEGWLINIRTAIETGARRGRKRCTS